MNVNRNNSIITFVSIINRGLSLMAFLAIFTWQTQAQVVGPYTGIDYATDYTNPDAGAPCGSIATINSEIGDADFINGSAEIPLGWSFSGTWNSGATYLDGPGDELLLVSLHTYTESWHVALRLTDGTTTAFADYDLTIVTDDATGSLATCGAIVYGFTYERPSQVLDFADFAIPPGVGVIGILFEPFSDGAGNPDVHGVIVLEDTPVDPPCDDLVTTVSATDICFGEEVTLEAASLNGGVVTWDGGVVDGVPFAPPVGVNTYTATSDAVEDCDFIVEITVNEIPDVTANVDDAEICLGESVIFTGGGADSYVWDMGVTDGVAFTPAAIGTVTYTVVGTTDEGCENTASVAVLVNEIPDVTASVDDSEICLGESIVFTGAGADSYVWDMGVIDGISFTPAVVGTETYTVTGTIAATGCQNTASVDVSVLSDLPVIANVDDDEVCLGEPVVFTGSGADTYVWDMGVTNGVAFIPPSEGTFTFTMIGTEAGGCSGTDDVTVTVHPLPVVDFSATETKGCNPFTTEFFTIIPGATFSWNFGDGASGGGSPVLHTYESAGTFDVILTVVDANGCTNDATKPSFIEVVETPVASFIYSPGTSNITDTRVEFTNTSMYGTSFEWNFGDGSSVVTDEHPIHEFPIVGNISYSVTLTVESDFGCTDQTTQIITVEDALFFFIPNAFTPDGDSFNDSFRPIFDLGLDIYDYHLVIYNRWGEVMFESYNDAYGWDGTYRNGAIVPDGVYTWAIEFGETMSDKKHEVSGHVTVLR
ncbi:PKD domain-containing protein [Crocinitomix sp.]|nr:PKD domain-containing protein [Crocinitomix sp.]